MKKKPQRGYLSFCADIKLLSYVSIFILFVITLFLALFLSYFIFVSKSANFLNVILTVPAIFISSFIAFISGIVFFSLHSMRYELKDDALYLIISPWKSKIFYSEIVEVQNKNFIFSPLSSFRLPGIALFDVDYSDEGLVRMCSTHALKDVVLIKTTKKKYGISPKDKEGFIAELQNKSEGAKIAKLEETKPIKREIHTSNFSTIEVIAWTIVIISFIVGIYFYPHLTQRIAIHWNTSGEVNTYLPKFPALFIFPFLFILLNLIPLIIPKGNSQETYIKFRRNYYQAILVAFIVMFSAYLYIILWNFGVKINFSVFFLFLLAGIGLSIIVQLILFKRINASKN